MCRIVLLGVGVLGLMGAALAASFKPAPVPEEIRSAYRGRQIDFGYLSVPEKRGDVRNERTIQLAVVILRARREEAWREPVFYLAGGPGSQTTNGGAFAVFERMAATRDVYLMDQRGTGWSRPFLGGDVTGLADVRDLRRGLARRGIDLSAYNTTENAADFEDLRRAFGLERVVIFGHSYGSFLAQAYARQFPENLRCVVLSGVLPADSTFIPAFNRNTRHGLGALFRDVARDRWASRRFPDLARRYFRLLRTLQADPLVLDSGATLTPALLQSRMQAWLQDPQTIRLIPLIIEEAEARRTDWLPRHIGGGATAARESALNRGTAFGMYLSVLGTDWNQPGWLRATQAGRIEPPILQELLQPVAVQVATLVGAWNVPYRPRRTRDQLFSTVPTLLLNGKMEAQTPPNGGQTVARTLLHRYNYTYPRSGHGTGFTAGPALDAMLDFIADPTRAPRFNLRPLLRPRFYVASRTQREARARFTRMAVPELPPMMLPPGW